MTRPPELGDNKAWRRHALGLSVALITAWGAAGCGRSDPDSRSVFDAQVAENVPADLVIGVSVESVAQAPLTAQRLAELKPDRGRGEGQAWRLARLFDPEAFTHPNAVLEVTSTSGDTLVMRSPSSRPGGAEAALVINRRGEVLITTMNFVDSSAPFHDRGGRNKRSGDTVFRLESPRALNLTRRPDVAPVANAREPANGASKLPVSGAQPGDRTARDRRKGGDGNTASGGALVLAVNDGRRLTVADAALTALTPIQLSKPGVDGPGPVAYDLRQLLATQLSAKARATELVAERGPAAAIAPADWTDARKIPTLRLNRQGNWRFTWVNADRKDAVGAGLRGVTEVRVTLDE